MKLDLNEFLSKLKKAAESMKESNSNDDDECDQEERRSIAECSIRIEHAKFRFGKMFGAMDHGKTKHLAVVNMAREMELNMYHFFLQVLEQKRDMKKPLKQIKESFESLAELMGKFAEACKEE